MVPLGLRFPGTETGTCDNGRVLSEGSCRFAACALAGVVYYENMFSNAFTICRILGFPIRIDPSWLLVAALVTWSLAAGYFPDQYPELSDGAYWTMGVIGMFGLFGSVLLHELGHAVVARRRGLEMGGITLFIFGGVAEMNAESESPKTEFLVAIGGPVVSLLLALGFWILNLFGLPMAFGAVVGYLAFVNTALLVFNMVPAFPLDGGRVLRAWLWHRSGSLRRATRTAARLGSIFGIFLIVLAVLELFAGAIVSAIWLGILGMFLRGIAKASYQQVVFRKLLEGQPVRRFMTERPITVEPDLPLDRFVEDYLYSHHHKCYPVVENGDLRGVIGTRDLHGVERDDWPTMTVGRVMREADDQATMGPETDSVHALEHMQRSGQSRVLIVDDGRNLLGMLTLKDLVSFLTTKLELEEDDAGTAAIRANVSRSH